MGTYWYYRSFWSSRFLSWVCFEQPMAIAPESKVFLSAYTLWSLNDGLFWNLRKPFVYLPETWWKPAGNWLETCWKPADNLRSRFPEVSRQSIINKPHGRHSYVGEFGHSWSRWNDIKIKNLNQLLRFLSWFCFKQPMAITSETKVFLELCSQSHF